MEESSKTCFLSFFLLYANFSNESTILDGLTSSDMFLDSYGPFGFFLL